MNIFELISRRTGASAVLTYSIDHPIILYTNKEHDKLTGYTSEELVGKSPKIFQGKNTNKSTIKCMKKSRIDNSYWLGNVKNYRKNGEEIDIQIMIFAVIFREVKYYIVYKNENGNKLKLLMRRILKLIHL